MNKKYYKVSEFAELLNVSEGTIYKLLNEGVLPGKRVGRLWRIPEDALETFEMLDSQEQQTEEVLEALDMPDSREQQKRSLGPAVISRRQLLSKYLPAAAFLPAAAGGFVSIIAATFLSVVAKAVYTEQADINEAKKIFERVFGSVGPMHSFSLGEPKYEGFYHRDNVAAANALIKPLGIYNDWKPLVVPSDYRIGIDPGAI